MEVGQRIIYEMERKGVSQKELAEKVNISKSVLNRILLGTRAARDNELKDIADALDLSVDYLLGRPTKNSSNDLKSMLKNASMTYGGKEISDHDLKVLEGIVASLLGGGENEH